MKTNLSAFRIKNIREQGYTNQSNQEVTDLAIGNRFAYQLCTSILLFAVIFSNIPLLTAMLSVAFLSVILPNHAFDYIYNYVIRHWLKLPKLPSRSKQLKFACSLATTWIATTIYFFYQNLFMAGYIAGGSLLSVAILVSTTDICIPSIIYNKLFNQKK